jgi:hypothetical protein
MVNANVESLTEKRAEHRLLQAKMQESLDRSTREALLEHARMGRPICEDQNGKVVWVQPAEIFARYGLDEFGRPQSK